MRAGCFAEDRVIDLINRRFVPFYYCTGGPGLGHDDAAKAFVGKKTRNPWAFLAAFDTKGNILAESKIYADKDETFALLQKLLKQHPQCNHKTDEEKAILAAVQGRGARDPKNRLAAGRLLEELGEYDAAREHYRWIVFTRDSRPLPGSADALLGLLRIHRYERDWDEHAKAEKLLREFIAEWREKREALLADADMESGYRRLARERFAGARRLLQRRAFRTGRSSPDSNRLAELHFYAGVACWRDGDRDWARFHFCWVQENLPEDRLARRAYIAAAAEEMPYPNPELGGFKAQRRGIGTGAIVQAYRMAVQRYRSLLPHFEAGEFHARIPKPKQIDVAKETDPTKLVRALRDGNAWVKKNNEIVERLVVLGQGSLEPALAAFRDEKFIGRGYAIWAAAKVMQATGKRPPHALRDVEAGVRSDDPYVRAISRSCQKILSGKIPERGSDKRR